MSRSNWNSSRIFIAKEASCMFSTLSSREPPSKNGRADLQAPPRALQACRSGCSLYAALLKVSIWGGPNLWAVASPQAHPLLRQIWSSNMGQEGNPAQTKQTSVSSGGKGELPVRGLGVSSGHNEHNTDSNKQKFICIFLSFFCNKISSVILALRDSSLLYAAAEV